MKKKNFYKNHITFFSRKIPFVLFLFTLLFIFLFTFSCSPIEDSTLSPDNNNNADDENINGDGTGEESINSDDANNGSSNKENDTDNEQSEETKTGEITINVYYADNMGEYLVGEARVVSSENKYVDALSELMKLPVDSSLYRLVPESTIINSIIVDGLAKVDLSNEFLENRIQSDTVDILLIYSIVNTLTEFSEVDSVSFYIDGEKLDILGEIDIKDPIFRRNDLIK